MFSGLRSDSMALSHVWFSLPGGRFQSMEACESQQQLHGDGLRQEQCGQLNRTHGNNSI